VEPDTPATEPTDVVESTDGAAVATEAAETTDPAEATDIVEAGDADAAKAATEDAAEAAEAIGDAAPAVVAAAPADLESPDDIALADKMKAGREQILSELHKKIIGQDEIIEQVLQTLFVGGNSLIVGVPGLAKTLLIQTMAQVLDLKFARIQFTPDLMPSDITGTDIIQDDPETGGRRMVFAPGPVFTNILLADEINRTPPKTQSALLEAMQEHRVTVQGRTYELDEPFFVFATQNPIELEGTYPLPEAQLDRFMFHIVIEHPPEHEELEVVRTTTITNNPDFKHAVTGDDLVAFQELVRKVPVSEAVMRYTLELVRTSRRNEKDGDGPDFVKKWVQYGASVRAAQYLVLGGKARALTQGRYHVNFDDIHALSRPVLRHRVLLNFHAESEGVTSDQIVDQLLEAVPVPASQM
jgi:MoxR-like ATPase